jgi:hypothetical protein
LENTSVAVRLIVDVFEGKGIEGEKSKMYVAVIAWLNDCHWPVSSVSRAPDYSKTQLLQIPRDQRKKIFITVIRYIKEEIC